jgi:putative ABC transport system ATP-binding protein
MPDVYDDPTTVSAGRFGFPLDSAARGVSFSHEARETGGVSPTLGSSSEGRTMTLSTPPPSLTPLSSVVLAGGRPTVVPLSREQAIARGFTVLDSPEEFGATGAPYAAASEAISSSAIGRPGSLGPLTELIQADPVRPMMPADAVLAATLRAEQGAVAWPEIIKPVTQSSTVTFAHEPVEVGIGQSTVDTGRLAIRDDSEWETHSPSIIDQRQIRGAGFSWPSELAVDRRLQDEPDDDSVSEDMGFEPGEVSFRGLRPDLSEFDEANIAARPAFVTLDEHELRGISLVSDQPVAVTGVESRVGPVVDSVVDPVVDPVVGFGVGFGSDPGVSLHDEPSTVLSWPLSIPDIDTLHRDGVPVPPSDVVEDVVEDVVPEVAVLPDFKLQDILGSVLATQFPQFSQSPQSVSESNEPMQAEELAAQVPLVSDDPFVAFGQPLVRSDAAISILEASEGTLDQPVWAVLEAAPVAPETRTSSDLASVDSASVDSASVDSVSVDSIEPPVVSWPVFEPSVFEPSVFEPSTNTVVESSQVAATFAPADVVGVPVWPTFGDEYSPVTETDVELLPVQDPNHLSPLPLQKRLEIVPSEKSAPPAPQLAPQVAGASQVPAISIRGISRSFPSPVGDVRVLDNIDLDLAPGDLVVINGASGSGVSTLLHCLAGFDIVDSGYLYINGDEMGAWSEADRARFRAAASGFIPQNLDLVDDLNVRDNAALPLLAAGWAVAAAHDEAVRVLSDLGLQDRLYFFPSQLSRSERTRTVVGRALAGDPFVIWADDPTASLDEDQTELVAAMLLTHHQRGATVVIGSRDPRFARASARIVSLSEGRLVPVEAPALRWGS